MEQWKIRPSVTLYPINQIITKLGMIGTPTHMQSFVKFRWVGFVPFFSRLLA